MSNQEIKNTKVIIVGAGAAGLGAAQHLAKNGCTDFIVLEASDRLGGRIHTVPFGFTSDNLIELGANWIHGGTMANPLLTQMCQHFTPTQRNKEIPYLERFHRICFAKSNGRMVELALGARALDHFFQVEKAAFSIYFRPNDDDATPTSGSLLDFMRENLERSVLADFPADERHDVRCVYNSLLAYLRFHVGDDLERVSLRDYGSFQEIPGGDVILPGGFQNLILTLTNDLPANVILTNRPVTKIEWPRTGSGAVTVTCGDGSAWRADHVIVTVSLGVLKRHHRTLFVPRLPESKERAMADIGFGCTNKIFFEFERPFWNAGFGNIGFGWTAEELAQAGPDEWEKSIYGLEEVYDNPHVLAAWIAGRSAEIMETVPEAEVTSKCMRLLKRFTGNDNIPAVRRIYRSTWRSNPHSRGSYSYATPQSGQNSIRALAQPLPSAELPSLLFAGEATHSNFFSTVHGAYLSGVREARRILDGADKERRLSTTSRL